MLAAILRRRQLAHNRLRFAAAFTRPLNSRMPLWRFLP